MKKERKNNKVMKVVKGNLFDMEVDCIAITINGFYTIQNEAVMGRGVAKQAKDKWPFIQKKLGYLLSLHGPHVNIILRKSKKNGRVYNVVGFPVKPKSGISTGKNVVRGLKRRFPVGSSVPGFMMKASLKLIERSARELVILSKAQGWKTIALPKPGCGAGELDWKSVRAVIKPILRGSKFIVVDMED